MGQIWRRRVERGGRSWSGTGGVGSPKLGKGLISVVGEDVRIAIECVGVLSWSCNLISIKGLVSRVKTIRMLGCCRMFLSILRGWYAAELVFSACDLRVRDGCDKLASWTCSTLANWRFCNTCQPKHLSLLPRGCTSEIAQNMGA